MLINVHEWPLFSNRTAAEEAKMFNSLEAIHDTIHLKVGGAVPNTTIRGDMGMNEVAGTTFCSQWKQMVSHELIGFDPIFFLHHAQVDRLMSLWQAINPEVWVTPGSSGGEDGGTWTIPDNTTLDGNTGVCRYTEISVTIIDQRCLQV